VRTFEDSTGEFTRQQVVLGISDALRVDYPGFDAIRQDAAVGYTGKTKTCSSIVADAARYFGVVPLATPASIGDFVVQGSGIFTQLVPSAQVETAIADARMNQQASALVAAGSTFTQTITSLFTTTQRMFFGGNVLPGSLSIVRSGVTVIDKGGILINQADATQVGTIDYANGVASLSTDVFGSTGGSHTVSYTPAAAPTIVTESFAFPVTQATQRLTYVASIDPAPARASLTASYRYQGRWYVLSDDGSGALRGGDTSVGVGTVNFSTGTVSLTLGSLPDVDSEVILSWAAQAQAPSLSTLAAAPDPLNNRVFLAVDLGGPIKPGTLAISWNDGVARSAGDLNGAITGADAVGEVSYAKGYVRISPNSLPAAGTVFTIAQTNGTDTQANVASFTDSGTAWTCTLSGTVRAGSVRLGVVGSLPFSTMPGVDVTQFRFFQIFDDGAGALKVASLHSNVTVGSVDYGTGAVSIAKTVSFVDTQATYTRTSWGVTGQASVVLSGVSDRTVTLSFVNGYGSDSDLTLPAWAWWTGAFGQAAKARYVGADGSAASGTVTLTTLASRQNLVRFTLGASTYAYSGSGVDRGIARDPSPTTGEGTPAGSWSPATSALYGAYGRTYFGASGYMELTNWPTGASAVIGNPSGITPPAIGGANSTALVDHAVFRTSLSPIKNGSFSVAGTLQNATVVTATADSTGAIKSGTNFVGPTPGTYGVYGMVNYETGVVRVYFGRRIHADNAGLSNVIDLTWLGIPGVAYVQVIGAFADTLRYNASAYSYLPLDADILGVDPVRLPSNGKVPIFRPGSFVVVGNTQTTSPATVSNGQTINVSRVRLSRVRVLGATGAVISTGYTTDLEAGTVTFTDVSGYAQPVSIEHRIEDMMLCSDAQINGQLTFTRAITHNYPAGSYISSALVIGDMKARTEHLFDQQTWSNVWSNELVGSAASATYNNVAHPIEVSNAGASTERWALVFTNTTAFNIIGEHVGVIGTGNTATDVAPLNPATGFPYFTLRAVGFGLGWATGNVLRFNTVGALYPIWLVRTIGQGPETVDSDSFTVLVRGDVDHP
jgi:hypothetical protein